MPVTGAVQAFGGWGATSVCWAGMLLHTLLFRPSSQQPDWLVPSGSCSFVCIALCTHPALCACTPPPTTPPPNPPACLQDLLCAATHSRAAYGFPAAEGLMGSVADFVRLQTLQPLSFDAVGGVSAEANNESVAALAGLDPADILMSEWRNSVWR